MAQQQITGDTGSLGADGALQVYEVPGSAVVTPGSVTASFDGTSAAGAFLPCLSFYSITGALIARCPAPEVAAGSSAEVSWFQSVGAQATANTGSGIVAAQVLQGSHVYAINAAHVITFNTATFTTSDSATFAMVSGTEMSIAHGGLILTGIICQFGPNGGIPYSGSFELSTEILDANNNPVDALTNPNYYTPELYGTDPGDTYNPNGYALFNCPDTTFTPPYTLKATIGNLTAITSFGIGLVVAILSPTGLT